jgi:hypothetical protein
MPEQPGHAIVHISQLGNRNLACYSVALKNQMLVADHIVCLGRRTKAIDSFLDRVSLYKDSLCEKHA